MPTPQQQNRAAAGRWLAHHILFRGVDHGMSLLSVDADGNISIEPFTAEVHSTAFHSGTITITENPTRLIFT